MSACRGWRTAASHLPGRSRAPPTVPFCCAWLTTALQPPWCLQIFLHPPAGHARWENPDRKVPEAITEDGILQLTNGGMWLLHTEHPGQCGELSIMASVDVGRTCTGSFGTVQSTQDQRGSAPACGPGRMHAEGLGPCQLQGEGSCALCGSSWPCSRCLAVYQECLGLHASVPGRQLVRTTACTCR